ncbi:MAG: phage portal protein [Patescibacteria group bacterium]
MAETAVVKARIISAPVSNKMPEDPFAQMYGEGGVLEPPYDLSILSQLPEYSDILPQCIGVMEVNVDGFGFMLEKQPWTKEGKDDKLPPEVEAEKLRIQAWFEYCNPEQSFTAIRRKTRRDLESTGNAYWELLRNGLGELAGIEHIEAYTMRLTKLDLEPIEVTLPVVRNGKIEEIRYLRRFRRYVQIRDNRKIFFKEFGDPRPIDARTGRVLNETDASAEGVLLATEVLHFTIYSSSSPYGVPRWIGCLPAVMGNRKADELNGGALDNANVPPIAILVNNGRLAKGATATIKRFLQEGKGIGMFTKALLLEVDAPIGEQQSSNVKIEKLTDAQTRDAMFTKFSDANRKKTRSAFRLPPLYTGETDDYTRATADASKEVADEQVFGPERDEFDFIINRRLMPVLGARFWKFKSLAATVDNAAAMTEMLKVFIEAGFTVREARAYMEEILNKPLNDPENADWLDLPVFRAKSGAANPMTTEEEQAAEEQRVQKLARLLVAVRKRMGEETLGIA